ncbi:MAG: FAD-dependent monooxygenase [Cyanobacteria bacterium REEB67]|nr:FAD-dependent monooxygenase [Cyanobacteria bacterium REEB67]
MNSSLDASARNQSPPECDCDVLIVGAGPVGLALANDCLSRGLKFKIIDRLAGLAASSETVIVNTRTLEHLGNLGFAEAFIEQGIALRGSNVYGQGKRIVHLDFDELDSPYKFLLALPLASAENLLADNLACAEILIERNCELLALEQDEYAVRSTVRCTAEGGASEDVIYRTKYVVGCDGQHSAVRELAGLRFEGAAEADIFGSADVAIDCDLQDDELHAYFSEHGAMVFIPQAEGRFRILFEAAVNAGGTAKVTGKTFDLPTLVDVVSKRAGKSLNLKEGAIGDPRSLTWFKVHRRAASSYQSGRIFLAGEAGHVHSPLLSTGFNTAVQDAINLGWKLGLASRNLASDTLLATYKEERQAASMAFLKTSDLSTKVVSLKSPVAKPVREALMAFMSAHELVQQRLLKSEAETALSYRGLSLAQESHRPQVESIGRSLFPLPFKKATIELPGLGAWMDFADAAKAGDFAPDAELDDFGFRLSHHIGSPRFKLLLFDGYEASEEGYKHLYELEYKVASRFCDWIDIYVVVPFGEQAKKLPNYALTIYDEERYLHEYYGASSECLYLLRPDGYIGFKGQPAIYEKLEEYLLRIFQATLVNAT